MRTTTGQCTLGDSVPSVTSVVIGVDVIVDGDQVSAAAWKSALDPFLRTYAAVRTL
jgi:hypothetical protein